MPDRAEGQLLQQQADVFFVPVVIAFATPYSAVAFVAFPSFRRVRAGGQGGGRGGSGGDVLKMSKLTYQSSAKGAL